MKGCKTSSQSVSAADRPVTHACGMQGYSSVAHGGLGLVETITATSAILVQCGNVWTNGGRFNAWVLLIG